MSEIETARTEFADAFRRRCPSPLDPETERRLEVIFDTTLAAGLRKRPGTWSAYRNFALPFVEEIGERVHAAASGNTVGVSLLVQHADDVICQASYVCDQKLASEPAAARDKIFCESYVYTTECQPLPGLAPTAAGQSAAAADGMTEQAWLDFQERFLHTCAEGAEIGPDVPAELRELYDRTVGRAILNGHVWDLSTATSRFALTRLHDVASLCIYAAGEGEITAAILRESAERVISHWRPRCKLGRRIFCETE